MTNASIRSAPAMIATALLLSGGCGVALPSAHATLQPNGPKTTSAVGTAGGLTLTVGAGRQYPKGALVPVRVTLRNTKSRPAWVWTVAPTQFGFLFPQVEVLGPSGSVAYPPALRGYPGLPGPAPSLMELGAHQSIVKTEDVVLSGDRIRATVRWSTIGRRDSGPFTSGTAVLRSRPLRVKLLPADAPSVVVHSSGGAPSADVTVTNPVPGKLLYVDWADCGLPATQEEHWYWTRTHPHLVPPCSSPRQWHGLVGQLGHSVARIDYPT